MVRALKKVLAFPLCGDSQSDARQPRRQIFHLGHHKANLQQAEKRHDEANRQGLDTYRTHALVWRLVTTSKGFRCAPLYAFRQA